MVAPTSCRRVTPSCKPPFHPSPRQRAPQPAYPADSRPAKVGAVATGQALPLWARQVTARLLVTSLIPEGATVARLAPGSEVHIAPKPRVGESTSGGLPQEAATRQLLGSGGASAGSGGAGRAAAGKDLQRGAGSSVADAQRRRSQGREEGEGEARGRAQVQAAQPRSVWLRVVAAGPGYLLNTCQLMGARGDGDSCISSTPVDSADTADPLTTIAAEATSTGAGAYAAAAAAAAVQSPAVLPNEAAAAANQPPIQSWLTSAVMVSSSTATDQGLRFGHPVQLSRPTAAPDPTATSLPAAASGPSGIIQPAPPNFMTQLVRDDAVPWGHVALAPPLIVALQIPVHQYLRLEQLPAPAAPQLLASCPALELRPLVAVGRFEDGSNGNPADSGDVVAAAAGGVQSAGYGGVNNEGSFQSGKRSGKGPRSVRFRHPPLGDDRDDAGGGGAPGWAGGLACGLHSVLTGRLPMLDIGSLLTGLTGLLMSAEEGPAAAARSTGSSGSGSGSGVGSGAAPTGPGGGRAHVGGPARCREAKGGAVAKGGPGQGGVSGGKGTEGKESGSAGGMRPANVAAAVDAWLRLQLAALVARSALPPGLVCRGEAGGGGSMVSGKQQEQQLGAAAAAGAAGRVGDGRREESREAAAVAAAVAALPMSGPLLVHFRLPSDSDERPAPSEAAAAAGAMMAAATAAGGLGGSSSGGASVAMDCSVVGSVVTGSGESMISSRDHLLVLIPQLPSSFLGHQNQITSPWCALPAAALSHPTSTLQLPQPPPASPPKISIGSALVIGSLSSPSVATLRHPSHLCHPSPSLRLASFPWLSQPLGDARRRLVTRLDLRRWGMLRRAALPLAGGPLICGGSGSGKSALLHLLGASLQAAPGYRCHQSTHLGSPDGAGGARALEASDKSGAGVESTAPAHVIIVGCRGLAGTRFERAAAVIGAAVAEAMGSCPGAVLFDDLDQLCPAPGDGPEQVSMLVLTHGCSLPERPSSCVVLCGRVLFVWGVYKR